MGFFIEDYHFKTGSLLEGLPKKDFRVLKDCMERKELKKGKTLYKEGSFPSGVYILRKGKIKISQTNKEGQEQVMYIYRKGEIIGYRPLISGQKHPVSAAALENCVLSFIPKNKFLEVLSTSLELSNRLLVNLAHEFTVWTNTISVLGLYPVRERVAMSLLLLDEKYKREDLPQAFTVIELSRDDLAHYVGTAKETLVRMLQDFKQRKIIRTEGRQKIIVLDHAELRKIVNLY